jgi:hypothetical protein
VASLHVPVLGRGASASTGEASLRIERAVGWRSAYLIRDERNGEELARIRTDRGRRTLEVGEHAGRWRRSRHGALALDRTGTALIRVTLRAGLVRSSGTVHVSPALTGHRAIAACLLAAYAVIRDLDRTAAAATGASVSA